MGMMSSLMSGWMIALMVLLMLAIIFALVAAGRWPSFYGRPSSLTAPLRLADGVSPV